MKKIILIAFLLITSIVKAQNLTEYKASNGIMYHLKDTVKLGRGSATNGTFLYMRPGGIESLGDNNTNSPDRVNMAKGFTNAAVIIKKIKSKKINGTVKVWFVVSGGYLYPFNLSIEEAIQTCEVTPCIQTNNKQMTSVADEIGKLKSLLNSGAITQSEYETQKKKVLSTN